jgi:hypothetical protein
VGQKIGETLIVGFKIVIASLKKTKIKILQG